MVWGVCCLGVYIPYSCLRFASSRPRISEQFTKNAIFKKGPCYVLYPHFSGNHQELFTSLIPVWALRPSPFCSSPINFNGPLGTSQVLCRTHFEHTVFFPRALVTPHPQCQFPQSSLNQQRGTILHHPLPTDIFLLSPVMPIMFGRSCLQTLAESYHCLASNPSSFFGDCDYQVSYTCSSPRAPYTNQYCLLSPSDSRIHGLQLPDISIHMDSKYLGCTI